MSSREGILVYSNLGKPSERACGLALDFAVAGGMSAESSAENPGGLSDATVRVRAGELGCWGGRHAMRFSSEER